MKRNQIRKWRRLLSDQWQPVLFAIGSLVALFFLYFFKLRSLTNYRASDSEQFTYAYQHSFSSGGTITGLVQQVTFLPYRLLLYGFEKLHLNTFWTLRAISAAIGILMIVAFYRLLRRWYTTRISLLGGILFASAAWMLHIGRLATPEILLTGSLLLVLGAVWLQDNHFKRSSLVLVTMLAVGCLYIPGLGLLVILGAIWQRKQLTREITDLGVPTVAGLSILIAVMLVPMIYGVITHPYSGLTVLGLPTHMVSIQTFLGNFWQVPINLFWHGPLDPVRWLGRLPILNVFLSFLFVIGVYAAGREWRLNRHKSLLGLLAVSWVVVAFGAVSISLLIPVVYLFVVNGIAWMLEQWLTVFPRNPFARTFGTTLMSVAVLLSVFYSFNHYFIAWPNAPRTKAAFTHRL